MRDQVGFTYLPLHTSSQTLAVPLHLVRQVRHVGYESGTATGSLPRRDLKAIPLNVLLNLSDTDQPRHAVILNSASGVYGLLVTGVGLPQTALTLHALPEVSRASRKLFSGVIAAEGHLILLLDADHIGETIQTAKLQGESTHAPV